ncbi:MAG: hypothetical protein V5A43_03880, partial [Haloarculaceae archaeon]
MPDNIYNLTYYLVPIGYLDPDRSRDVRGLSHSDVECVRDAVVIVSPEDRRVELTEAEDRRVELT